MTAGGGSWARAVKCSPDKLKVPLQNADSGEQDKLLHLGKELHKTVITQDEAIKRDRGGFTAGSGGPVFGKRPLPAFCFSGQQGR